MKALILFIMFATGVFFSYLNIDRIFMFEPMALVSIIQNVCDAHKSEQPWDETKEQEIKKECEEAERKHRRKNELLILAPTLITIVFMIPIALFM